MSVFDGLVGAVAGAVAGGVLTACGYLYKRRLDRRDAASEEENARKARIAQHELDQVTTFHSIAYELLTRLANVAAILTGPQNVSDAQRATYLDDLIGKAERVRNLWDGAGGSIDSRELRSALDDVETVVRCDILPPLTRGDLPADLAALQRALAVYREIANRRIGTRL
jgi:hypothetical protein